MFGRVKTNLAFVKVKVLVLTAFKSVLLSLIYTMWAPKTNHSANVYYKMDKFEILKKWKKHVEHIKHEYIIMSELS